MAFKDLFTLFTKSNKKDISENLKLINLFTPFFSEDSSKLANDTWMNCVNTFAKHVRKIEPAPYFKSTSLESKRPQLYKVLTSQPNPFTEAGAFYDKLARVYIDDSNVFIYIDWDEKGEVRSLWILDPLLIDSYYHEQQRKVYLKFTLNNETIVTPTDNIIHIARNVDESYFLGGKDYNALSGLFKIVNTNYEGIVKAIKTSALLRFVVTTSTNMKAEDLKERAKVFAESFLDVEGENGGVGYVGGGENIIQVNNQQRYSNFKELELFEKKIMRYFNTSEKILDGNYSDLEFQAYQESNIEPLIKSLANEMSLKLFSDRERAQGNRIIIKTAVLRFASLTNKISMISNTKDIGLMSINEQRDLLDLPPVDWGEKHLVSLNYINSEIADQYQLNKVKDNGGNQNG